MVVVLHYVVHHVQTTPATFPAYVQAYGLYLSSGVDIFFVLSGYLLGGILLDRRDAPNCLAIFYIRRAFRIIPPYVFVLVCYGIAVVWWTSSPSPGLEWLFERPIPSWPYLLFVQNIVMADQNRFGVLFLVVTWSLAVEEQFYLLLPWVLRRASLNAVPRVCGTFILAALAFRLTVTLSHPGADLARQVLLPARWDSLFFGVLAAWLVRHDWLAGVIQQKVHILRVALLGCFLILALLPFLERMHNPFISSSVYSFVALTCAVFLIYLRLQRGSYVARCLQCGALRYFGRLSYMIYLCHVPIMGICFSLLTGQQPILAKGSDWVVSLVAFALTIAVAEATWRSFEFPLIRLGQRLDYRPARAPRLAENLL
jgi:peptidoglycan/LPS O-acetylase OafA/YrhL